MKRELRDELDVLMEVFDSGLTLEEAKIVAEGKLARVLTVIDDIEYDLQVQYDNVHSDSADDIQFELKKVLDRLY